MWRQFSFGNRKKSTLLLKHFSQRTSLHGFHYIVGGKSGAWKVWLWRFLFAVCMLSVISGLYHMTLDFLMEPQRVFTSHKLSEHGTDIHSEFPKEVRITICKMPAWDNDNETDFLNKYGFAVLGYPFHGLIKDEKDYWIHTGAEEKLQFFPSFIEELNQTRAEYRKKMQDYNETYFIQNGSTTCSDMFVYTDKYCETFKAILTTYGQCYSRLFDESGTHQLNLRYSGHRTFDEPEGFVFFAAHPLENAAFVDSASFVLVPPGSYVQIQISLEVIKRNAIYTPWHGLTEDCPSLPEYIEPSEYLRALYSPKSCIQRYILDYTENLRSCSTVLGARKRNYSACSPDDLINGYRNWILSDFGSEKIKRKQNCKSPCVEYQYHLRWQLTTVGYPTDVVILYTYERDHFKLHDYKKVSMNAVLSQIGGFLGLYLGASIFTLVEIIGFLSLFCWYIVTPRRRRRVLCQSKLWNFKGAKTLQPIKRLRV